MNDKTALIQGHPGVDQWTMEGLLARRYWTAFNKEMHGVCQHLQAITEVHAPDLWSQYAEGLITGAELINKLVDTLAGDMTSGFMNTVCAEILARCDSQLKRFADEWEWLARYLYPTSEAYIAKACHGRFMLCHRMAADVGTIGNEPLSRME